MFRDFFFFLGGGGGGLRLRGFGVWGFWGVGVQFFGFRGLR